MIDKIGEVDAIKILFWQYTPPYDWYNLEGCEDCLDELLDQHYYVGKDGSGRLIGFYCYEKSAQVTRGKELGFYQDTTYLDIGLGMNPLFCGQGLGAEFVAEGMRFAKEKFQVHKFRLTVARFNERAIRTYEKVGFVKVGSFIRELSSEKTCFDVMIYEENQS